MRTSALLLLLGAGCQAGGGAAAEDALSAGRVEEAEWLLRNEAARSPGDAGLRTRWEEVRARAAAARLASIDALLKSGDLKGAERQAETAVYYAPGNAEYRRRFGEVRGLRRDVRERIRQADEATGRRDWVRARRILEPIRVFDASFPRIAELWPSVAKENYALAMREGERFTKVMDYDEARRWYDDALALFPGDADAGARRKTAEDRARARSLAREAENLLAADKPFDALIPAREAGALHPESRYATALLEEALRRSALEHLAEERRAREAGRFREALAAVRRALALSVPHPGLRAEIEAREEAASKATAARLMASGARADAEGRGGAAWACYALADLVRPGFTGAKERRDAAAARLSSKAVYRLLVVPAAEAPRAAPGSGETFARALREAIARRFADRAKGYGPGDLDGDVLRETRLAPDAVARGSLDEMWLSAEPPRIERRSVRYESGRIPKLNPGVEEAKARWQRAQAEVPASARNVEASEKRLRAVQAERDRAQGQYNAVASRPANTLQELQRKNADLYAVDQRLQEIQNRFLLQTFETTTMRATHTAIERDVEDTLHAYLNEPPYVFEPVHRDYAYEEAIFETKASLRGKLSVLDPSSGGAPREVPLEASFSLKDSVVAPFPEAGLRGDPKDSPPDAELLFRLAAQAADKACASMETALRGHGERFLARAAAERREKRLLGELHYLATAWHARSSLDEPRLRELVERVKELAGLDLASGRAEVGLLSPDLLR